MKKIPFHKVKLNKEAEKKLIDVVRSGWLTSGQQVKLFEKEIKDVLGIKYGLAVSSCTAALHLAYLLVGLKKGDEVIVPSYTFCSTINTIVHTGATPIFCDILPDTLCVDPDDVKRKITKNTKAVVIVHFAGMAASVNKIKGICKSYGIKIIEDAAHAFHVKYNNKFIGSHGNITCFSFYATKTLTSGEGGFLALTSKKQEDEARILALHGMSKNAWSRYEKKMNWRYDVVATGYKYNLSDLHAAVGLSQIPNIQKDQDKRHDIAFRYANGLSHIKDIILPPMTGSSKATHAWHLFVIRVVKEDDRDKLIEALAEEGIGSSVHFIANHTQSFYKENTKKTYLPNTEKISNTVISLPIYPTLSKKDVDYIIKTICAFYDKLKR